MQRKAALALMPCHDSRHGALAQRAQHHPYFGDHCAFWVKCSMASLHAVSTSLSKPRLLQVGSVRRNTICGNSA